MANGFGGSSSGSGGGSPTQLYYSVTYAQAQSAVSGGSVVRGATYFISDRNVELTGVAVDSFSLDGRFLRSGEWNYCEFDFDNDHVQLEKDDRGNSVGCSALAITYGLVSQDPRGIFRWGDDLCLNNTVWNAEFDCDSSAGQVYGNVVTDGSLVELTGDGNFFNNNIDGTSEITATTFDGDFYLNTLKQGSVVDLSGSVVTVEQCLFTGGSDCDFTLHTGTLTNIICHNGVIDAADTCVLDSVQVNTAVLDASDTCDLSRAIFDGGGTATVSGSTVAQNIHVGSSSSFTATGGSASNASIVEGSTVTLAGTASMVSAKINFSTLDASGASIADIVQMYMGSTLTISGTVDATGVYMTTGATCTATDQVFMEGLIMRNVGQITLAGDVSISPGEIENQSIVDLSGSGNYGNCFWKGVTVNGVGTGFLNECHLEYVNIEVVTGGGSRLGYLQYNYRNTAPVFRLDSVQNNIYCNNNHSDKTETFTVATNAIDFDAADINHFTGNVVIDSTDTIDTISNMQVTISLVNYDIAPKRFRITPTTGNVVTIAAATATNIVLPNGVATITLTGNNGDWVELEHDGTNAYVIEINNF